jgi:hypothetical protein
MFAMRNLSFEFYGRLDFFAFLKTKLIDAIRKYLKYFFSTIHEDLPRKRLSAYNQRSLGKEIPMVQNSIL